MSKFTTFIKLTAMLINKFVDDLGETGSLPLVGIDSENRFIIQYLGETEILCKFSSYESGVNHLTKKRNKYDTSLNRRLYQGWRRLQAKIEEATGEEIEVIEEPVKEEPVRVEPEPKQEVSTTVEPEVLDEIEIEYQSRVFINGMIKKHASGERIIPDEKIEQFTKTTGIQFDSIGKMFLATTREDFMSHQAAWIELFNDIEEYEVPGVTEELIRINVL